jgi:hypothetical protein
MKAYTAPTGEEIKARDYRDFAQRLAQTQDAIPLGRALLLSLQEEKKVGRDHAVSFYSRIRAKDTAPTSSEFLDEARKARLTASIGAIAINVTKESASSLYHKAILCSLGYEALGKITKSAAEQSSNLQEFRRNLDSLIEQAFLSA